MGAVTKGNKPPGPWDGHGAQADDSGKLGEELGNEHLELGSRPGQCRRVATEPRLRGQRVAEGQEPGRARSPTEALSQQSPIYSKTREDRNDYGRSCSPKESRTL